MGLACRETLKDTLQRLFALRRLGIRPGLGAVRALLALLGDPQKGLRAVHIAGTNGKGSTAAMIESVLRAAGQTTGLYTSPHLQRFNERIRVSGLPLADGALAGLAAEVLERAEELGSAEGLEITFFEAATAMAFLHFRRTGVQTAVLEAGMGGRLDATNVAEPLVTVITGVDLDHTAFLGQTLREIAAEKAGIIKPGVPVVTGRLAPEAARVVGGRARALGAPLYVLGRDFVSEPGPRGTIRYRGPGLEIDGLSPGLRGAHQVDNAGLALCATGLLGRTMEGLREEAARRGVQGVDWPARLELVRTDPPVLIDSAHNPAGARALAREALAAFPRRPSSLTLVTAISGDKDLGGVLAPLLPISDRVILTEVPGGRAACTAALRRAAVQAWGKGRRGAGTGPVLVEEPALGRALSRALGELPPGGGVLVAGSIFLAGPAREILLQSPGERGEGPS